MIESGKQKTAFGLGTLYFRHTAKSEHATADDLRLFVERKLAKIKDFWMAGITQVIEAPPDSIVAVMPSEVRLSDAPDATPVRITHEMAARILQAPSIDHTHPYRQKEVIEAFNKRTNSQTRINQHHLLCVRRAHNSHRDLKFCYNMNWSSPRYSEAFVEWLVEQHRKNPKFFDEAKERSDRLKKGEGSDVG